MRNRLISIGLSVLLAMLFLGCSDNVPDYKKKLNVKAGLSPQLTFDRYEDVLFNLDTSRFQQELISIQKDYQPFLNGDLNNPEAVRYLRAFVEDSLSVRLYRKVKSVYPDLSEVGVIVSDVYRYFNYYYPKIQLPDHVFTCVSGVDPESPSIMFFDEGLVISLDWYLEGDAVYERIGMPRYRAERTNQSGIAKDLAQQLYLNYIRHEHKQSDLLEEMIDAGKMYYFIEAMCPSISDEVLLGYTNSQMKWAEENEGNIWADLVGNQRLYASDYELFRTFFADGPFTNEYSHEAPPRLGEFLGLHIMRSYMGSHNVSLQNLMDDMDFQRIFQESGYKPKK